MQAPTYGLAEQAARIIRATYNGVGWPSANGQNAVSSDSTTSDAPSPTHSTTDNHKNGATVTRLSYGGSLVLAVAGVLASLLL